MSRWAWLGAVGLVLAAGSASAAYIGIFIDPNASSCAANVGPNPRVDLHIIAILEGDVLEMTGAQFKIVGIPPTWTAQDVLWVPDTSATVSLGNPAFVTSFHPETPGVDIAHSSCKRASESSRVPLGRLVLLGPPTADNVRLQVTGFALVPVDPDCPFVGDCNFPNFSKVCVGGGEIVLNGPAPASCAVGVEQKTWATVKVMYE